MHSFLLSASSGSVSTLLTTNTVVATLIPIVKALNLIAFIAAIGIFYAMGFLIPEERASLTPEAIRLRPAALVATSAWVLTLFGSFFLELANLLGGSLGSAFDIGSAHDFIAQTSVGRDYVAQLIIGLALLASISRIKRVRGTYFALTLTLIALAIPVFQSHASNAGNHELAIGSLLFHVIFVSLWVGGVFGLLLVSQSTREFAISRFSAMALWAAVIVGVSGVANAWTRLNFLKGWQSAYGVLVIIKALLFVALLVFGAKHRSYIAQLAQKSSTAGQVIYRLLANEIIILVAAVVLGAWLGSINPPTSPTAIALQADPVVAITGTPMPAAPNLTRILTAWVPDGTVIGFLLLITFLYIKGVRVLVKRGDSWPVGRTISFALAVAAVDFATSGGLGVYARFAFSDHMIAHMILGMIAPIGFVLSAPITLALRTLPQGRTPEERGLRGTLIALIHSRYSKIITNPIVALALFDGSLFVLYLTPLFGTLMKSHSGHLFMDLHFLLAGYLFFYVIVGVDPNPRKIPHIVRIIMLFAAMAIHAFFSVALLSASTLLDGGYFASLNRPWATNLLADQHTGGAIGWAMGEIPILIALIATFIQWVRDDSREAKRSDRASDRAAAMGVEDELAAYNKYLAALNARDKNE